MLKSSIAMVSCAFLMLHAPHAHAGSTLIDFIDDTVGLLTEQIPAGSLTAQSNKGVFAGPAATQNVVYLEYNGARITTSGSNTVSIRIRLHPAGDVSDQLCMFIADASFPADACTACLDVGDLSFMELRDVNGNTENLSVPFPNAPANEFTLSYDLVTEEAVLQRPASGGGTVQVSLEAAVEGATSVVVGMFTTGSGAINNILFEGADIPDFPPAIERDMPNIDFTFQSPGFGTSEFPFATLGAATAEANPGATLLIAPGTTDETPILSTALTLTNANPGGGSVTIGAVSARQSGAPVSARTGFVSRR